MSCIYRLVSFLMGLAFAAKTVEKAINSEVTLIRDTAQQLQMDFKEAGTTPDADSTSREGSPRLLEYQRRAEEIRSHLSNVER